MESSNSLSAASNGSYRAPSVRASHRIIGETTYFAFKKLDVLFPNNESERKDFKEKADYVDEKFEAMIVDGVLIFYGDILQ